MTIRSHGYRELTGATAWLNTEPLHPADLRGQVVLVQFWTFTCINWLRTAPYVRAWSHAYRDDGLVVVGVHTPEFSFEHDLARVRGAARERGIDYPIAVDSSYQVWNDFENQYWPALYFLDREGRVRDHHFGEGRYPQSEHTLQQLLGIDRPLVQVVGEDVEAEADWAHLRTPETYLGAARGERLPHGTRTGPGHELGFEMPAGLRSNQWALDGSWEIGAEKVVLNRGTGTVAIRFHARDAHLVIARRTASPLPFRVSLDHEPPGSSHGADVDRAGHGTVGDSRLYQLVRQHGPVRERTLEITFLAPGAEAYAFTFG